MTRRGDWENYRRRYMVRRSIKYIDWCYNCNEHNFMESVSPYLGRCTECGLLQAKGGDGGEAS